MRRKSYWITSPLVFASVFCECLAQETCYPAGGVAGIVIATIIVTAIATILISVLGWKIWKRKRVRKKPPEPPRREMTQKNSGDFAFDNPYFRDPEDDEPDSVRGKYRTSLNNKTPLRSSKTDQLANKSKKGKSSKGHNFIFGSGVGGARKQRTMDDTYLAVEPERTLVALKGHDFTGLGFNICGNMRDGILVKDVLHRGPASESGRIKAGDRIISVTVSFANIVYEDALTILSYASPYDVQLELERTPEKSNNMEETPNTAKRLGSGSFSNPGPKLFHPLYRSQSIDDLTQIDRDTFPSHGFGPRRSQSVGVAAHKLAAHFKNSDTRLEDKDRSSTSVILSTTGSLNEKMLANVMADGGLHKNGLQWEKRFEDNLDDQPPIEIDQSQNAKHADMKQKMPSTSLEENRTSDNSDDRPNTSRKIFRGSNNRSSKQQKDRLTENVDTGNEVRTTAQIHQQSSDSKDKCKTMSEASKAVWHLDQTIKDADSDLESSKSYPWNRDRNSEHKGPKSQPKRHESELKSNTVAGEESDVSGDSLEGERQRRKKKPRPKTPSVDEVSPQVNEIDEYRSCKTTDYDRARPSSSGNLQSEQKTSKQNRKTPNHSHREQNCSLDSQNKQGVVHYEDKYSCDVLTSRPLNQCPCTGPTQAFNMDKRIERTTLNSAHSPTAAGNLQRSTLDGYPSRNESPYSKTHHFQHNSPYSSANSSESGRMVERPYPSEWQDPSLNSRAHKYLPNNGNSVCDNPTGNRGRFTPQQYQQRPQQCTEYQKSPLVVDKHVHQRYDDEMRRIEAPRNGPPSYYQALRKANPAGMFTQINPFQQPSNRQRNNFSTKPRVAKEMVVNGNEGHCSMGHSKSVQVTTSDSSGCPRSRMEPSPYSQKMSEVGHSKTLLISTFDNTNNNNQSVNFRHMRK